MYPERNTHHAFWERHDYRQKPLSLLRGLVVARNVLVVAHKELHANLAPPPMPTRPLAHNIVNYLEDKRFSQPLDVMFHTVDYLHKVANSETLVLASHLEQQLGYLVGQAYE